MALPVTVVDELGAPLPPQVAPGATVIGSSGSVANVAAVASIPGVAGLTNYLTGVSISGSGATAASRVIGLLTGLIGGAGLRFIIAVPANVDAPIEPTFIAFPYPIPASAPNTAIRLDVPALGAGSTNFSCDIIGFRR